MDQSVEKVGHLQDCNIQGEYSRYLGRDDLGYYWECQHCKGVIGPMEDFGPDDAYGDFDDD